MSLFPPTITHATHPHPLSRIDAGNQYVCNGCRAFGSSTRYRCNACDFDLHEVCATCPSSLFFTMHPQHPLILNDPTSLSQAMCTCNVCRQRVTGFFYRCALCDFDAHPLCTQFPEKKGKSTLEKIESGVRMVNGIAAAITGIEFLSE